MALERVQKILANAGYCSRREAETLIEQGLVSVDGVVITIGDKADVSSQEISVRGEPLVVERRRYLAFYKPRNVLTTLSDPSRKPDITRYLGEVDERVFPVGRLDYDAEGLLLLTNDGDFANLVMHPRYETVKTYVAHLDKELSTADVKEIVGETVLEDGPVLVRDAQKVHATGIRVSIHEGKNHIVKRLLKAHGFTVVQLKRVAIDAIELGSLRPGELRELTAAEIAAIQSHA